MKQIVLFFLLFSFFSCQSDIKPKAEQIAYNIELQEGERWTVNEEMKPPILEAEEVLADYLKQNGTDYLKLEGELRMLNQTLIKSCSMKGESHDELHKWLLPHMDLLKALKDSKNAAEADQQVANLEASFMAYHRYFK